MVKGVPAASLAYRNPSGVLPDNDNSLFEEETLRDVDDETGAAEVTAGGGGDDIGGGRNGDVSGGLRGSGNGDDNGGTGSSRFRYQPPPTDISSGLRTTRVHSRSRTNDRKL